MQICGTIAKVYDVDAGEYIGVPYKNMDVVVNEVKQEGMPYSRVAFRLKGEHLERFIGEGVAHDGLLHTYELVGEVSEREWKMDGKLHPSNRMFVCVGWK